MRQQLAYIYLPTFSYDHYKQPLTKRMAERMKHNGVLYMMPTIVALMRQAMGLVEDFNGAAELGTMTPHVEKRSEKGGRKATSSQFMSLD